MDISENALQLQPELAKSSWARCEEDVGRSVNTAARWSLHAGLCSGTPDSDLICLIQIFTITATPQNAAGRLPLIESTLEIRLSKSALKGCCRRSRAARWVGGCRPAEVNIDGLQ